MRRFHPEIKYAYFVPTFTNKYKRCFWNEGICKISKNKYSPSHILNLLQANLQTNIIGRLFDFPGLRCKLPDLTVYRMYIHIYIMYIYIYIYIYIYTIQERRSSEIHIYLLRWSGSSIEFHGTQFQFRGSDNFFVHTHVDCTVRPVFIQPVFVQHYKVKLS